MEFTTQNDRVEKIKIIKKSSIVNSQTCHFDLTQNLNECEKKSKYKEKNLNLTTKIALIYIDLYQIQSQKKSEFRVSLSEFRLILGKNLNDSGG